MPRYMLDTNICIYVINNYPARLRERFHRFAAGSLSGEQQQAENFASRILDANPNFTIKYLRARVEEPEVMFEGLRLAGLPEG